MPQWVTELGIPCFRPHVRRDKAGKKLYEVSAADLPEIVRNSSTLTVDLHGDKPPITEGHRNFAPDAKEEDQPLVLGYQDNFRLGQLPDGTPAILCDRHYLAQYADRATRHPYASVDYLPNRKAIVGLAKLTRPPELNLGAVMYPGLGEPVYVYAMGDQPVDEPEKKPEEIDKPGPAEAAGTPELTPEEQEGSEKVYRYLCSKYKWISHYAAKYDADMAAGPGQPQGNNTTVPSDKKKDEDGGDKGDEDVSKNQADTALIQKYQSDLSALRLEVEAGKVDKLLDNLEKVERYQFDRAKEAERMLALSTADRLARCEEIRKYHHQLPGGELIQVYRGNVEGPAQSDSKETVDAAVKYATKHGTDWDESLAAVKAGKR